MISEFISPALQKTTSQNETSKQCLQKFPCHHSKQKALRHTMKQGQQISAEDIKGLSSGQRAAAPAYLTDEFTNRDIFGTMRGQCTAVRVRNNTIYEAMWQAKSAELNHRLVCAVQGLRWLLEGDCRLHGQRGGQRIWGRHRLCLTLPQEPRISTHA